MFIHNNKARNFWFLCQRNYYESNIEQFSENSLYNYCLIEFSKLPNTFNKPHDEFRGDKVLYLFPMKIYRKSQM